MESPALVAALAACVGAAAMLLVVAVRTAPGRRSRADLEARLASAQHEVEDLRRSLDDLVARSVPDAPGRGPRSGEAEFVITHVGEPGEAEPAGATVADRLVLSATLGEPLIKAAAFSHGLRRALSADARNRIWFEVRREVRASRRRRRQLRKRLEREYRAALRATDDAALEGVVMESTA